MKSSLKTQNFSKEWLTLFEKSNQLKSPNYEDTNSYFKKFEDKTPYARLFSIGKSPQGREINCIVVSNNGEFTPEKAKQSGKAIVLIQNGIHAGEIEGKDASMLLLRDILVTKEKFDLLKNIILLIIPIFNVDGHERLGPYNRPNQIGPMMMGWRTTSQNLNLNRDYMKADSPEMKAWLKLFNEWLPDFMIDNHTTNGADYQYHITYGLERQANISPLLSDWIKSKYLPYLIKNVEKDGYLITRYIELKGEKLSDGLIDYPMSPRFSTGYAAVQNRICLLVETHSLKPFSNRVFSTKSIITHTLRFIDRNHQELISLNKKADVSTVNYHLKKGKVLPIDFEGTNEFQKFLFKGYETYEEFSELIGNNIIRYTKNPIEIEIPLFNKTRIKNAVSVPYAYIIPREYSALTEILELHGIKFKTLSEPQQVYIQKYRFINTEFSPLPYEGRQQVKVNVVVFEDNIEIDEGSFVVPTNQRTLRVLVNLLEPFSPDSFLQWGFFNSIFERKEYIEPFILEPIARQMLKTDYKLSKEFYNRINSDESFRNNPTERLEFFYRNSPYFDKNENVYPIVRTNQKII